VKKENKRPEDPIPSPSPKREGSSTTQASTISPAAASAVALPLLEERAGVRSACGLASSPPAGGGVRLAGAAG